MTVPAVICSDSRCYSGENKQQRRVAFCASVGADKLWTKMQTTPTLFAWYTCTSSWVLVSRPTITINLCFDTSRISPDRVNTMASVSGFPCNLCPPPSIGQDPVDFHQAPRRMKSALTDELEHKPGSNRGHCAWQQQASESEGCASENELDVSSPALQPSEGSYPECCHEERAYGACSLSDPSSPGCLRDSSRTLPISIPETRYVLGTGHAHKPHCGSHSAPRLMLVC